VYAAIVLLLCALVFYLWLVPLGFPACGAVSEPIAFDILFDFPQGYGLSSSCYLDSLSWLLEIRHRWIVTSR
jgi:hypothetical protein